MGYSQRIDWSEEVEGETYENLGRNLLIDSCKHHNKETGKDETIARYSGYCEKCEISENSASPMMNFLYPLETTPNDEDILKVVKETNCTIIEKEGNYFLTLCGGGMDLSQDIALSYVILEKWIPEDLINSVCSQKDFSISKKNYEILRKAIIEQSQNYAERFLSIKKKWEEI